MSSPQVGERLCEVGLCCVFLSNQCFVDAKCGHSVRVLMYPGVVSGDAGVGNATLVHLIQLQCNHVFYENLCFIGRSLNFCDNIDDLLMCVGFVYCCLLCDMQNSVIQFLHNLMEVEAGQVAPEWIGRARKPRNH